MGFAENSGQYLFLINICSEPEAKGRGITFRSTKNKNFQSRSYYYLQAFLGF